MQKRPEIHTNKPSLAPLEDYAALLSDAWATGVLTHNGPLVQRLEKELRTHFSTTRLAAVTSGTMALQLALKALNLRGEVITSPFSWIATCSAIMWENCRPVFADIDSKTFNIDPKAIEEAITPKTVAIMPIHVFSNPCDVHAISEIAAHHNLSVIYDAAHAAFVNYRGRSILDFGDVSATSFHATKIFNCGEGGACVSSTAELHESIKRKRFFGHNSEREIVDLGCNGKMTELHAALGLANLRYIDATLNNRRSLYERYIDNLGDVEKLGFQVFDPESYNFSYMPIVCETSELMESISAALGQQSIYARRYFHPSLNKISAIASYEPMPRAEDLANKILCLPLYEALSEELVDQVCEIIRATASS